MFGSLYVCEMSTMRWRLEPSTFGTFGDLKRHLLLYLSYVPDLECVHPEATQMFTSRGITNEPEVSALGTSVVVALGLQLSEHNAMDVKEKLCCSAGRLSALCRFHQR